MVDGSVYINILTVLKSLENYNFITGKLLQDLSMSSRGCSRERVSVL